MTTPTSPTNTFNIPQAPLPPFTTLLPKTEQTSPQRVTQSAMPVLQRVPVSRLLTISVPIHPYSPPIPLITMPPAPKRPLPDPLPLRPEKKQALQRVDENIGEVSRKNEIAPRPFDAVSPCDDKKSWETLLNNGVQLFSKEQYKEGIDVIRQSYQIHQSDVFITHLLSQCHLELSKHSTLMYINQGLYQNGKDSYWLFLRGLCNIKPTKYKEAHEAFLLILEHNQHEPLINHLILHVEKMISREEKKTSYSGPTKPSIAFLLDKA